MPPGWNKPSQTMNPNTTTSKRRRDDRDRDEEAMDAAGIDRTVAVEGNLRGKEQEKVNIGKRREPPSSPSSSSSVSSSSDESRGRLGKRRRLDKEEDDGSLSSSSRSSDDEDDSVYYDSEPNSGGGDDSDSDSDSDSSSGSSGSGSGSGSDSDSDSNSDSDSESEEEAEDNGPPEEISSAAVTVTTTTTPTKTTIITTAPTAKKTTTTTSTFVIKTKANSTTPLIDPQNDLPPVGVTYYSSSASTPSETHSYYQQRYRLFSRFDDGIYMTPNSWYEVTPEPVAIRIANKLLDYPITNSNPPSTVLDAFCGIGGNSIQFALHPNCKSVIALDTDPAAIWCARKNAQLHGVGHKITFLQMDFFEFARSKGGDEAGKGGQDDVDIVFCSPPWGGPTYRSHEVFDINTMKPYSFRQVWEGAMQALTVGSRGMISTTTGKGPAELTSKKLHKKKNRQRKREKIAAFFMPRTSNLNQFAEFIPDGETAEVVHYYCGLRSKAVCLYVGVGGGGEANEDDYDDDEEEDEEEEPSEVQRKAEEVWARVSRKNNSSDSGASASGSGSGKSAIMAPEWRW